MGLSFEREGSIKLAWASRDGQHVKTLLHQYTANGTDHGFIEPAWSADGRCLAYTELSSPSDMDGMTEYGLGVVHGKQQVPFGGSGGEAASWDASGRRIVADDIFGDGLFIESLDSSSEDQPTDWGTSPAWSPDGATIAFDRFNYQTRTTHMFLIAPDGSGERQLTTISGGNPTWAPDSRRIAFDDGHRIAVINADGTGLKYLAKPPGNRDVFDPAWSPGGHKIAFVRSHYRPGLVSGDTGDIWTVSPTGKGLRLFIRNAGMPAWKPG